MIGALIYAEMFARSLEVVTIHHHGLIPVIVHDLEDLARWLDTRALSAGAGLFGLDASTTRELFGAASLAADLAIESERPRVVSAFRTSEADWIGTTVHTLREGVWHAEGAEPVPTR